MAVNSEARKRQSEAEAAAIAKCEEHRREVVRDCLAAIYSGAGFQEADAFLDQLADRHGRVVL